MSKIIRSIFLIFIYLILINPMVAQTWDWSAQFGNEGNEIVSGLEISESGDYFIAGGFSETIEIGSTSLESIGFSDVFLSGFNPEGEAQWAVSGGSANIDETAGISLDPLKNIIWTGQFWVQGFFGSDTVFAQSNSKAIFLAKYDETGSYLWSKSISGSAIKVINDVATDSESNIYLTGYFEDSLFVDEITLVASQEQNFFILKFDASGNLIWGKNYGASGTIRGSCLEVDQNENIVVGGYFQGVVDFDGFMLQSNNIYFDLFVVKFNPSGTAIWAKEALGVYDNICSSIAIDLQNNIYLSGSFIGEMSLSDDLKVTTPGFKENLFLLKYNSDGSPIWARALNAEEFNDISLGLDIEVYEQVIGMTGYFNGALIIDELSITAQSDQFNGFVATFNTFDGKVDWLQLIAGSDHLIGTQIASDPEGRFTLGGYFDDEAYFDDTGMISNGLNDIYVSKLIDISTADFEVELAESDFEIFPNPATNVVNILGDSNVIFIKIYDLHGRLIRRLENEKSIDVSNLTSGNYLLQIGNESGVKNVLFIKM